MPFVFSKLRNELRELAKHPAHQCKGYYPISQMDKNVFRASSFKKRIDAQNRQGKRDSRNGAMQSTMLKSSEIAFS